MRQRLLNHINSIQNRKLRLTCESIPRFEKFFTWPASLSHHHAYEGGLLNHTVEVCDIAREIERATSLGVNKPVKFDILFTASLWHDLLKIDEYEIQDWPHYALVQDRRPRHLVRNDDATGLNVWIGTDFQKTIGHIVGSAAQFQASAIHNGVDRATIDAVVHCILAHHGRKEWGSPVEPQTLEALILRQADMLSANYGATKDLPDAR